MKKSWFLIIGIFTLSLLQAQKSDTNENTTKNDTAKQSKKSSCCDNKQMKEVFIKAQKEMPEAVSGTKPVKRINTGSFEKTLTTIDANALQVETGKPLVEIVSLNTTNCPETNLNNPEEEISFDDLNDPRVQAAYNWFKNKKGLN
jgi:hypothetical protein